MKIGDVVIPKEGCCDAYNDIIGWTTFQLHCGTGRYTHAIVASLEPFILVSDDGTMMWNTTVKPYYFQSLCQAHPKIQRIVKRRLNRETKSGILCHIFKKLINLGVMKRY